MTQVTATAPAPLVGAGVGAVPATSSSSDPPRSDRGSTSRTTFSMRLKSPMFSRKYARATWRAWPFCPLQWLSALTPCRSLGSVVCRESLKDVSAGADGLENAPRLTEGAASDAAGHGGAPAAIATGIAALAPARTPLELGVRARAASDASLAGAGGDATSDGDGSAAASAAAAADTIATALHEWLTANEASNATAVASYQVPVVVSRPVHARTSHRRSVMDQVRPAV